MLAENAILGRNAILGAERVTEDVSSLHQDTLRFITCGSVDDGKSTLIGRLLYDSRGVYEDQLQAIQKASKNKLDLSLLTDGLRAEREQGITIDVAYRYFATAKRRFILGDSPGHEQYTRNMATAASTASLAILLIDARNGIMRQSKRHGYIASLLGIREFVVAINKMDLAGFAEARYNEIRDEYRAFLKGLGNINAYFLPMSALDGDNVVERGARMNWFDGPPLLEYLESVQIREDVSTNFRMPVQYVIRPDLNFRGFAGQIASGAIRTGDRVTALPSGKSSRVSRIVTFDGDIEEAAAPVSVTISLEDEIDIARGDLLASGDMPRPARRLEASLVWMSEQPLDPAKSYWIKHTSHTTRATIAQVVNQVDIQTLELQPARRLELNGIGNIVIDCAKPLVFDPYDSNRVTGAFVLIDPETNATAGAGMIRRAADRRKGVVTKQEREVRHGHRAAILRLGARFELARLVERVLFDRGCLAAVTSNQQAAEALASAGAIALLVHGAAGFSDNDDAAVEEAIQQLRADGVFLEDAHNTEGEGI